MRARTPRLRFLLISLVFWGEVLRGVASGQAGNAAATTWTVEEATRVLQDSAWAQQKFILIPTGRITQHPTVIGRQRAADSVTVPDRVAAIYLVRWESAQPVISAFARLAELGETTLAGFLALPPSEPPARDPDYYLVTVKAKEPPQPLTHDLFARFEAAELQTKAELKSSRGRSVPASLALRSGVGASSAVHFYFPRKLKGVPLLTPRDTWIEFVFTGRYGTQLKAKFKRELVQ